MLTLAKCPACKSSDISAVQSFERFPAILFAIEPEKAASVAEAPLRIGGCRNCGHLFATSIDEKFNSELYTDYYYLYPFSQLESMEAQYRTPFKSAFDYLTSAIGPQKRLLEIGCSDEAELSDFLALGFQCTGISPGAKPSHKIEMIDGFYEAHALSKKYDVIVSRFNLEHIVDLDRFFGKVNSDLDQHGLFVVQVPNVEFFLRAGILNVFAHEHPQYFCAHSLRQVFDRLGFECVSMQGENSPSLVFAGRRKSPVPQTIELLSRNQKYLKQLQSAFETYRDKKIVLYGASLSLTALLYDEGRSADLDERILIVDDNPKLWGRTMPHSRVPIQGFSEDLSNDAIVILMLNPIYHDRVLKKIANAGAKTVLALTETGLRPILG
jgi:hypothetical protein